MYVKIKNFRNSIKFVLIFFFLSSLYFTAPDSMSAAWTQNKGEGQLILNLSGYKSSSYYNDEFEIHKSNTKFTKFELNPFVELGVFDNLTVGINPTIQNWHFDKSLESDTIYDFRQCGVASSVDASTVDAFYIDSEIFARAKVFSIENLVLSLQPLIKTPCILYINGFFTIAEDTIDFEMRALAGYGFKWSPDIDLGFVKRPFAGQNHFINVETAYRKRNPQFADQIKIDTSVGMRFNKDLLFMTQVFSTFSVGDEPVRGVIGNNGLFVEKDDYYTVKAQASLVRQVTKNTSLQLGVFKEVLGKNSGNGVGATVSLWYSF
jgi:hypothetical protein